MDAASRRELDALRRRAWGVGGGLDDDPAAQARLAELELAAGTRGTCLPEEAHRRNALLVVIPASDIPIDARPEGMTESDAVGFWWRADDNVEVVLAPLPAAAP